MLTSEHSTRTLEALPQRVSYAFLRFMLSSGAPPGVACVFADVGERCSLVDGHVVALDQNCGSSFEGPSHVQNTRMVALQRLDYA